jgi:hypothetical protein
MPTVLGVLADGAVISLLVGLSVAALQLFSFRRLVLNPEWTQEQSELVLICVPAAAYVAYRVYFSLLSRLTDLLPLSWAGKLMQYHVCTACIVQKLSELSLIIVFAQQNL